MGWSGFCKGLFWISASLVAFTYAGYPIVLMILARLRPRPWSRRDITPSVTLLIAAYNEERCILKKIENCLALEYPSERLEIVFVTDGSTDRTNALIRAHGGDRVRLLFSPCRRGKSAALARAFPLTQGEIVVFSDANSYLHPATLRRVVRHFADPSVGGVGGAKRFSGGERLSTAVGEGLYWRYESFLKRCESAVGSVMGTPGELWAARRSVYDPPDPMIVLDDFWASMRIIQKGWRVVFDPELCAYEEASPSFIAEWWRRVRNVAGGWQAILQLGGICLRAPLLVRFQYLSHRVLRWMVVPFCFPVLLVSNLFLISNPWYRLGLGLQMLFYLVAGAGYLAARRGKRRGLWIAPFYLCFLNAAALVGGVRYLFRGQSPIWEKVR